jgi:hypothetical protein
MWVPTFLRDIQWKLIIITLGLALFDNNNRLITLSGEYKNLHHLTQFIVTVQPFTCTGCPKKVVAFSKKFLWAPDVILEFLATGTAGISIKTRSI